ncbi:MAG TPA: hypothetical protein VGG97_16715, partial [Bryobacteraceae bacterium]
MRKSGSNCLTRRALLAAALTAGILHGTDALPKSQTTASAAGALDWKQGVVNKYCLGCHNA